MSHYLNYLLLFVSINLLGKRRWYLRNLRLITNWMNHPVFPFTATFYLIAAISKWLSAGLLRNASLKIRRAQAGRHMLLCSRRQACGSSHGAHNCSYFFHSGPLIKGHQFSSEAAITNTQSGCLLVAYSHFLGAWFLVVEASSP